ncbi:MAG: hypothetical protein RIT27_1387 [Pseudomonadota bacterium]|jgi:nitrous oxide reductase accessory protein NosL
MKLLWCSLIILLSACSKNPQTGPIEIKWDRDACEQCRMALSDRHFAVQIRGGKNADIFKFDDLGCALHWLEEQDWKNDSNIEIWVKDFQTEQWLDAQKAFYVPNQTTPMDYGLGATMKKTDFTLGFDAARKTILTKTHHHSH